MEVTPIATTNEDERKLFVGALPQEAKDAAIREHFGQFGEIESVTLKTDPSTGRSRGFCFVLFKEAAGLSAAMAADATAHVIKGKKVVCKQAEAKQGKIYVGKLPNEGVTKEDIQTHFGQFGTVAEVTQPVDKTNNDKPKNFAFVTFEKEEVAKELVKLGTCNINGHDIDVKKVTMKDNSRGGFGGGFGGRGGGFGGGFGAGGGGGWGGYGADPYGMGGGYGGGFGGYGADPYGMGAGGYGGYGGYGGGAGGKVRGGGRGRGRGRSRPY